MGTYIELGTLLVALIILYLLIVFVQNPVAILINALIAIGILFLLNAIFNIGIPINIITVAIVALGGLPGLLLLIIIRLLGLGFARVEV